MPAETTLLFDRSEWIGRGKSWPLKPPRPLHQAIEASLQIPELFRVAIPKPQITVNNLLKFPLPKPGSGSDPSTLSSYFTTDPNGTLSIHDLLEIPLPSRTLVQKIHTEWCQAFLDGKTSLVDWRFSQRGKVYPPWVIGWWLNIFDAVDAQVHWTECKAWLIERVSQGGNLAEISSQALATFSSLAWNVPLNGVAAKELRTNQLWSLLSSALLSQSIVNGMLLLTRQKVELRSELKDVVEVCDLTLMDTLRRKSIDWIAYDLRPDDPNHRWFRRLAASLGPRQTQHLFIPIYREPEHWALFWLDLRAGTIQYGDSLQWPPPYADIQLLQTWLGKHGIVLKFDGIFEVGTQLDAISCAIVMVNGVERPLLNKPLWNQKDADCLRIEKYMELYNEHTGKVRFVSAGAQTRC